MSRTFPGHTPPEIPGQLGLGDAGQAPPPQESSTPQEMSPPRKTGEQDRRPVELRQEDIEHLLHLMGVEPFEDPLLTLADLRGLEGRLIVAWRMGR